ncbi:MMPL family transporter [Niveibacterium sp. 24ML]|uniref:MMPL family transporter n=1 Tax=Niveibacterium sp. 24ML TaxID=2985512 RepID=UPI00226FDC0C|nr:MMPL family transporter [Niveibacterium sp. 24ML]MCX9157653.1 MMPL family transporter [Niveibacterium sp. 24ML]
MLWLLLVLAACAHLAWLGVVERPRPDSDVMALLPQDDRDPVAEAAFARMAASAERRVVVMIGAANAAAARKAADAYLAGLAGVAAEVRHRVDGGDLAAWRGFLAPYRGGLLSEQGRALLALNADQRADHALARLYSPASGGGLAWREDPLGLFADWLMDQASGQRVRTVDGRLWVSAEGREWAVVLLNLKDGAFSLDAQQALVDHLDAGRRRARAAQADVEILTAGIAPIAAAVAAEARNEFSAIGIGSTLGVILLVFLVFRRPGALVLSVLPLLVGTLCAVSATWLVFERVHVLTLVFGASLIGVGVDYGVHFLASGIGEQPFDPKRRRDQLNPGLWLAMVTTVLAYVALALAPFPGLRQMALFSGCGLVAAWLTVMLWFPYLQRRATHGTGVGEWMGHLRAIWPSFGRGKLGGLMMLITFAVLAAGLARIEVQDDVRALQSAPAALLAEQMRVATLAGVPSPAQFFVVQGASPEAVLQAQEALAPRLAARVADGTLSGYELLARHIPSAARQAADCAMLKAAYEAPVWRARIADTTGIDAASLSSPLACKPLAFDAWLANAVSEPFRSLWLGRIGEQYAGVVLLKGVHGAAALGRLQSLGEGIPGVSWVDKPGRISSVIARYRGLMSGVIVLGYLASFWLLWRRYGRETWRAVVPTLLASLLAAAALGIAGLPFQLFAVLGLFIVLGMGIDYGIFLLEHPRSDDGKPWLAVTLSAFSTLLSFGLLALSHTPALRVFGLVCLVGVGSSWLLAPAFARRGVQ